MKPMGKSLGVAAAVALVTGCNYGASAFHCSDDRSCGAGGACESSSGFCSFPDSACESGRRYGELAGGQSNKCVGAVEPGVDAAIDAPIEAAVDAAPDAAVCFGTFLELCLQSAPSGPLPISVPTTIDTSNSPMCAPLRSGGDFCVLAGTTISITSTLRATGPKPLVLIASDSITIDAAG